MWILLYMLIPVFEVDHTNMLLTREEGIAGIVCTKRKLDLEIQVEGKLVIETLDTLLLIFPNHNFLHIHVLIIYHFYIIMDSYSTYVLYYK